MSNEMTLKDALTYIFGDTQEEQLAMEEMIDCFLLLHKNSLIFYLGTFI